MMLPRDQNHINQNGGALKVERHGATVTIDLVCETEEEAINLYSRILSDVRSRGEVTMCMKGYINEGKPQ